MNFYYLVIITAGVLLVTSLILFSIPYFLEQPKYSVELSDGRFQLRVYETFTTAKVKTKGERYEALKSGFRPLVKYIGAKARSGNSISMTVPVMQQKQEGTEWVISFFMPSKFSHTSLPLPFDQSVILEEVFHNKMASITFNGSTSTISLEKKKEALMEWIEKNNFTMTGEPIFAFYNGPMTPGFLRKNEILITVEKN